MSLVITLAENTPETNLPAGIINKLYNLTYVTSNGVTSLRQDRPTSLIGTINLVDPTYQEYVTALTTQYPQFHVNASSYYALFEDAAAQQLCATKWGDGTGVTTTRLALLNNNNLTEAFKNNTTITKFNEFRYFTGISEINKTFNDCQNVEEITIPPVSSLYLNMSVFSGCYALNKLNGTEYITKIRSSNFWGVKITELNLPNCTQILGENWSTSYAKEIFLNMSELKKISFNLLTKLVNNDTGTSYSDSTFGRCGKLTILDLGSSITEYGGNIFNAAVSSLKAIVFRTSSPPTITFKSDNNTWGNSTSIIYVPASALSAYLSASVFSDLGSTRLKTIENDYNEADILAS